MTGYISFLLFCSAVAILYLTRDKSLDSEKEKNCDLW